MEHKEINMQNAQAELKAVAKAAGASLKRAGHSVPHSVLLHALSAALNKRDWHILKASLTGDALQNHPSPEAKAAAAPAPSTPAVPAKFWTDDHRVEVDFDAAPYLAVTSDKDLLAIIEVGFSGDYCTDAVAELASAHVEDIKEGFDYLDVVNRPQTRESIGFECRLDEDDYLRWMDKNRRALLAGFLCNRLEVTVVQAQEEEIRGMWDWIGSPAAGPGTACECSYSTSEEACLAAYDQLGLLEIAIAQGY